MRRGLELLQRTGHASVRWGLIDTSLVLVGVINSATAGVVQAIQQG